jgi:hypothetical protein
MTKVFLFSFKILLINIGRVTRRWEISKARMTCQAHPSFAYGRKSMHNNVCHKVKPEQHEEYYKLKLPLPLPS